MNTAPITALRQIAGVIAALLVLGSGVVRAKEPQTVPVSSLSLATALADAHRLAALKGDKVVRVSGVSMLPYFGEGSVLVVRATPVEALRPGMVAVYRNRFGEMVAHRIEARDGEAWTVRGANNLDSDSTRVTAENLLGTVYVTFYSDPRSADEGLRLAGDLAGTTPVALAAAAR